MTKEQLIESYKKKISELDKMIQNGSQEINIVRWKTKYSDFRAFITELERLEDEN